MLRITLFFSLVAALAVAAFAVWDLNIRPAGPHTTQARTVGAFHRVEVHGGAHVHVRPGRSPALTVSGPRERVHATTTRVQDGTLVVGERDSAHWVDLSDHDQIVVTVHAPSVDMVVLDGSGHVWLPPAHGGTTRVRIDGSGDVDGSGRVDDLEAAVNGSGGVHLRDLSALRAHVTISGSGDAEVDARRSLDATVHGSGAVRYAGRPRLAREVDGSGSVSAAEASLAALRNSG